MRLFNSLLRVEPQNIPPSLLFVKLAEALHRCALNNLPCSTIRLTDLNLRLWRHRREDFTPVT